RLAVVELLPHLGPDRPVEAVPSDPAEGDDVAVVAEEVGVVEVVPDELRAGLRIVRPNVGEWRTEDTRRLHTRRPGDDATSVANGVAPVVLLGSRQEGGVGPLRVG